MHASANRAICVDRLVVSASPQHLPKILVPTNENARNPEVSGAFIMTISQCSGRSILSSAFGQPLACAGYCVLGFCFRPTSNFHRFASLSAVPANLPPTCVGDRSLWRCRPTRLPNLTVYRSPASPSADPPTCVGDRLRTRLSTDFQCPACSSVE